MERNNHKPHDAAIELPPQIEVHVRGLSLSTELVVANEDGTSSSLPTVANEILSGVHALLPGKTRRVKKHILRDINAVFRPGTMTLVLGQPGSGKSSLLKALSGRFPLSKSTKFEGDITYNGRSQSEVQRRLPHLVSYVSQQDSHFASLTVKETLAFAHECCGSPHRYVDGVEQEVQSANACQFTADAVLQQLGLEACQGTIVGDAMTRGVSGGERKRVTMGEMAFGNRLVACMDEISTGLDSATTFDIMKAERRLVKAQQKTLIVALLQPPPEVFELFDNVLLLSQGMVAYFGPVGQVLPYFRSLGLVCPQHRDVAGFLVDLTTPQQSQYEILRANRPVPPSTTQEFSSAFEQSNLFEELQDVLYPTDANLKVATAAQPQLDLLFNDSFHQTFLASTCTLLRRQRIMLLRDTLLIKARILTVIIVGLLLSSLFFQFNPLRVEVAVGTIYAAMLFMGFVQSLRIPAYLEAREVFYKQRGANFYSTPAYVIATTLSQLPLAVVESVIFGSIVYWVSGFVADTAAFIVFLIVILATNLAFGAWFFFLSSLASNRLVGQVIGMLSVLFYTLFAGFILTKHSMPAYFLWVYWGSPISWGLRALAINQYRAYAFTSCTFGDTGVDYCRLTSKPSVGEYLLGVFEFETATVWIWAGIAFLIVYFIIFMALSCLVLENIRHEGPELVTLDKTRPEETPESDEEIFTLSDLDERDKYRLTLSPRSHHICPRRDESRVFIHSSHTRLS
ncbi:hypothetical protein PINS_up013887 [Pythium insidiosum]|nr:hypothetical protein PINS_up013887 [Pythium insidiosum]